MSIKDLAPGKSGTVVSVEAKGAVRRRLFDMGLTPGTQVRVRKTAPLGDPIEITLRGYELVLRSAEAKAVKIEASDRGRR
ncbi:MAG TPA: ferrous iron transport protein A [Ruminococcaceae bacterium]|nr:ferrous iron transport protein A [Oscillospiraceae bacterium]